MNQNVKNQTQVSIIAFEKDKILREEDEKILKEMKPGNDKIFAETKASLEAQAKVKVDEIQKIIEEKKEFIRQT